MAGHSHEHGPGPMADASVRRARPSDAPAVGVIQAETFAQTYAARLPSEVIAAFEPRAFAKVWREGLENPPAGAHALFVACAGAQVVGFVAVGPAQDPDAAGDQAEVTVLCVHPAARRQGHGSRLLNAAADHVRELGAGGMSAWVLVEEEGTRGFVQGAGFDPDGAFRDRVVSADGDTLREVRLSCTLAEADEP